MITTRTYNRSGLMALQAAGLGDLLPSLSPELTTSTPPDWSVQDQGLSGLEGLGFNLPTDIDWKKWAMVAGAAVLVYFLIKRKSGYAGAVEAAKSRHKEELARIRKQYKRGGSRVAEAASSAWSAF